VVELSWVGRCDHAVKLLNAICTLGTYSNHYAYSVHMKASAYISQNSGVSPDEQQSERREEPPLHMKPYEAIPTYRRPLLLAKKTVCAVTENGNCRLRVGKRSCEGRVGSVADSPCIYAGSNDLTFR